MRFQRLVLALAAAGVLVAGATAASPQPHNLITATPVTVLAADGSTVAIATAWSAAHCERLWAWNPARATIHGLGKGGRCVETSTGRAIAGQAVAGTRVAWIDDGGGNDHDAVLYTASLAKPSVTHRLLLATRSIDSGAGNWVGGLRGAGSLLVYGTWSVCETGDAPTKPCPAGVTPGTISNAKLWRIDGLTGKKLIASAPDALIPVGVSAGRVLVARGDGSLELRGADGHVIRSFPFDTPPLQAALSPKELFVAVRSAANPPLSKAQVVIQVYSLATGTLERTVSPAPTSLVISPQRCTSPVGAPASACVTPAAQLRFGNADATRFLYILGTSVHVLRGASETSPTGPSPRPVFAQLLKTGYAYSYPTGLRGRVLYLPSP